MFREMRRKKQLLSAEESIEILNSGTSGVLGVYGNDGYPYTVPLSYIYHNSKLYFHIAKEGHKLDAIKNCDKVSFCVISKDEIVPQEFTTYFKSVIVFGRARIIEDDNEKMHAITLLGEKYSPNVPGLSNEIEQSFNRLHMIELNIEHMTGKAAIELIRKKEDAE